ncbi:MAG TPA: cellulase family glycosylhydrolase [Mycobacteriales bacterium]|nr:cellulase family glycosylhydrolase [Mycobacteriales bacterium]
MKRALALGIVAVLAALGAPAAGAAGGAGERPAPPRSAYAATGDRPMSFLHVGGVGSNGLRQIVDSHGRTVLLRGVNIDGLVDYWQPSLEPPYPTSPAAYRDHRCPRDDPHVEGVPICWFDLPQMRRLGYDNIRLNVSWSLLEPRPSHIDRRYIARIAQVVGWARRQGIWVTIDMHQDAWSKYVFTPAGAKCPPPTGPTVGYDGAPKWATRSALPACTVDNIRELDPAVIGDAQAFWSDFTAPDGVGLQEHYARVLAVLAKRFADDPAVAGYDLMNEPEPGTLPEAENTVEMLPFWAKVARTIRKAVPTFRQLLFFEPGVERNTTSQRAYFTPWSAVSSYPNAVYAPHIYTDVFSLGAETGLPEIATFASDYAAAMGDAKALGLPLWVGEFGGPPASDGTVLAQQYAQQEQHLLGGTMWLWKENANDTEPNTFWGVYGPPFYGRSIRGTAQPKRVRRTSRVYPVLTDGTLLTATSDPFTGTAKVVATARHAVTAGDRTAATLVEVPAVFRGAISVSGASYRVQRRGADREVWLFPRGGRYSLRVSTPGPG